ncbi:MAG: hypothetical protein PHQ27_00295 [Victivallales bacterium]|nr:hypothetical protein [Victivallales bacterium]
MGVMMKLHVIFLFILLGPVVWAGEIDGIFGVKIGQNGTTFHPEKPLATYSSDLPYYPFTPPQPSPIFESYRVCISPADGKIAVLEAFCKCETPEEVEMKFQALCKWASQYYKIKKEEIRRNNNEICFTDYKNQRGVQFIKAPVNPRTATSPLVKISANTSAATSPGILAYCFDSETFYLAQEKWTEMYTFMRMVEGAFGLKLGSKYISTASLIGNQPGYKFEPAKKMSGYEDYRVMTGSISNLVSRIEATRKFADRAAARKEVEAIGKVIEEKYQVSPKEESADSRHYEPHYDGRYITVSCHENRVTIVYGDKELERQAGRERKATGTRIDASVL